MSSRFPNQCVGNPPWPRHFGETGAFWRGEGRSDRLLTLLRSEPPDLSPRSFSEWGLRQGAHPSFSRSQRTACTGLLYHAE